ncbi:MAG: 1-(5-phosphoribosyl)-5-[(5-phosphoribosylamino)methylideneamino]imidazole-4-carboxamide isomerase [Bacteroidota bacterium]|jgi:phosphoribosylformimino-5-aminoimidazole carboxamide ribotide isomerase
MTFTVYPAIDLREGKVVRLKEGDPARMTVYSADPVETARRWMDAGASWLHVVNLDGAFGVNDIDNRQALEDILNLDVKIQFGGGMRSRDAIERAIKLGVSRVVLGTIAIEQPDLVASAMAIYGEDRVSVGIDARDGMVRVRGWKESGGISATGLALQMRDLGLRTVIFTDVGRDGLGRGLNVASTRELAETSGLDVIASGGVHSMDDVIAAKQADLAGVIIGRALYDGTIDLPEAIRIVNH